jgi:hypothetical protein
LGEVLEELHEAGLLVPCSAASFDRREFPPLPGFVTIIPEPARALPVPPEARNFPWRPPLTWGAELDLSAEEFDLLKAVNAFLRDGGASRPVVPTQERSLSLFGHEKTLDRLLRTRLFAPGRLSLDLLRAYRIAPPFPWRRVGDGPVLLVLENSATFVSVVACMPPAGPVGVVAYGGGAAFIASVAHTVELTKEAASPTPITEIRYFGDLDRKGLTIPLAAADTATVLGLPTVLPAVHLWALLLELARPQPAPAVPHEVALELVTWLDAHHRKQALDYLTGGYRLAQETVGTEQLADDAIWATMMGLRGER